MIDILQHSIFGATSERLPAFAYTIRAGNAHVLELVPLGRWFLYVIVGISLVEAVCVGVLWWSSVQPVTMLIPTLGAIAVVTAAGHGFYTLMQRVGVRACFDRHTRMLWLKPYRQQAWQYYTFDAFTAVCFSSIGLKVHGQNPWKRPAYAITLMLRTGADEAESLPLIAGTRKASLQRYAAQIATFMGLPLRTDKTCPELHLVP